MIHPTAHVHPQAELGRDVEVGPGAIIEKSCVIGDQCVIRAHAVITGEAKIGEKNQIGYGAIIGSEPQDISFRGAPSHVIIGDRNTIREYVTIHRGSQENSMTQIGNDNFLMVGSHVAHNCKVGHHVILVNNVLLAGHVEVHDYAFLGGGSVVHQFTRIGQLAIVRGQTRIGRDLPPFFMATDTNQVQGLNRIGLRRAGIDPSIRRQLQTAYDLLYDSKLNINQAVEHIEATLKGSEITTLLSFIRQSKRGICLARPPLRGEALASVQGK